MTEYQRYANCEGLGHPFIGLDDSRQGPDTVRRCACGARSEPVSAPVKPEPNAAVEMKELPYHVFQTMYKTNKYAFYNNEISYEEYTRVEFWLSNLLDSGYFRGRVSE